MHKNDTMTPNQRLMAFMTGQPMDRCLCIPFCCTMSGQFCDMTHKEKRATAESEARCQIEGYKRLGNDLMIVEYGLHQFGRRLGTKATDPEKSGPALTEFVIESLEEFEQKIDTLDFDLLLPENDPFCQQKIKCAQIIRDEIGEEVSTGMLLAAPFSAMFSIVKPEVMLRALRKRPDLVKKLQEKTAATFKALCKAFIEQAGTMILYCEPFTSADLISTKAFEEFVYPTIKECIQYIHECKGMCCLHICGSAIKLIDMMAESGADMISIDEKCDWAEVCNIAGSKKTVVGNVAPVDYFILGGKEDIEAECKKVIKTAYKNPYGFVLASGCDLSGYVPIENIEYFMEAARKYGKMPINPDNWED